ncbi:hypothetical protein JW698_00995 [Candidatus Wolfebacteria bacterium]|nr:hypothetical protein [Candidatus Wolfebacteria bacterium]
MQQKLQEIINKSSLIDSQKSKWKVFLSFVGPEVTQSILDILESNPEELNFLTKNLEGKINAIDNPDRAKWNDILKEEKRHLRDME